MKKFFIILSILNIFFTYNFSLADRAGGGNDDRLLYAEENIRSVIRGLAITLSGTTDFEFQQIVTQFPGLVIDRNVFIDILKRSTEHFQPLTHSTRTLKNGEVVPLKLDYFKGQTANDSYIVILGLFMSRYDQKELKFKDREISISLFHEISHIFGLGLTEDSDSDEDTNNLSVKFSNLLANLVSKNISQCGLSGSTEERINNCDVTVLDKWKIVSAGKNTANWKMSDDAFILTPSNFLNIEIMLNDNIILSYNSSIFSKRGLLKPNLDNNNIESAEEICASFENTGGKLGSWRLPTEEEIRLIIGNYAFPTINRNPDNCIWTSKPGIFYCADDQLKSAPVKIFSEAIEQSVYCIK